MEISLLQNQTNNALGAIQSKLPRLDTKELPRTVYHYTDSSGFLGIIKSGSLWATNYRFLNDSSELNYVFRLAADIIRKDFQGKHTGLAGAFLEQAVIASPPYGNTPYYLCCFSELDNSLSQWRAYGGRQGFSLSFPGDVSIHQFGNPDRMQNPGSTLLQVIYDQAQQKSYIGALLNSLVELCASEHMKGYRGYTEALSSFMPFFWAQLERASYRFKHPDFKVEQEWRLVAWGEIHKELYRANSTIVPYTEFQLFSSSSPIRERALPLLAVRCGPSELQEETQYAMDRFLGNHGYMANFCERLTSSTPARMRT